MTPSETLANLLADSVVLEEKRPQHLSHRYPLLNCLTFDPPVERLGEVEREALQDGCFSRQLHALVGQACWPSAPATRLVGFSHGVRAAPLSLLLGIPGYL